MKKLTNSNEAFSNEQFEAKTIAAKNEMEEKLGPEFSLKLFSKSKAARYLNVSWDAINKFIEEGRLGYILKGKGAAVPGYELIRFLAENLVRSKREEVKPNYNIDVFRLSNRAEKMCQSFDSMNLFENLKREGIHG